MLSAVRKIDWLYSETGYGNGYVALPPGHKYHLVDYDNIDVQVHGGLTFSELMTENYAEKWSEFRHFPNGYWIIGFDTAHFGDNQNDQNREYVLNQIEILIKQLI